VDRLKTSIARYFNMPPDIVNVASEAGPLQYQTDEQSMLRLVKLTLQPYADAIGEALSAYLPGDYLLGDRIVISLQHLLTADQLTRYNAYSVAITSGWLLKSEVRTKENLPPIDGIDDVAEPAPVTGGLNVGA
jgi:phage portal protein BeeE